MKMSDKAKDWWDVRVVYGGMDCTSLCAGDSADDALATLKRCLADPERITRVISITPLGETSGAKAVGKSSMFNRKPSRGRRSSTKRPRRR
jgi:hypothetical protein